MRAGEFKEAAKILCLVLLAIGLALMSGCGSDNVRPDLPRADPVTPRVVVVERKVYVGIEPELTQQRSIAEGPIEQCWQVASDRKTEPFKANSQLAEIATVQGTEVAP